MRISKALYLFGLSILLTIAAPFAAAMTCEETATATMSLSAFESKINQAYRNLGPLKERLGVAAEFGLTPFRPFKVTEIREFFPNNQLPSIAKLNEVRVIRASREEGINELRKSVFMNEERGWIFLPTENIWVYNTVSADIRNFGGNGLLTNSLIALYGGVEIYHNHPNAASRKNYDENEYRRHGLTFEQYHPDIAIPSSVDLLGLMDSVDIQNKRAHSARVGFVVSEFGVTKFRTRSFLYHNGQRDTAIYPACTVDSQYKVLQEGLPPLLAIRKILMLAEISSTEEISCMEDICKWTPDTAPKILFEFTPWATPFQP